MAKTALKLIPPGPIALKTPVELRAFIEKTSPKIDRINYEGQEDRQIKEGVYKKYFSTITIRFFDDDGEKIFRKIEIEEDDIEFSEDDSGFLIRKILPPFSSPGSYEIVLEYNQGSEDDLKENIDKDGAGTISDNPHTDDMNSAANNSKNNALTARLDVLDFYQRSVPIISGAWVGLYHWSEKEGRTWNSELKKFTEKDWKSLVAQMHEVGMNIVVIQEVFRNQKYYGKHRIEKRGYKGKAFYPSKLYKRRMDIAAYDPIEAILSEADRRDMHVFLGLGHYAWFDFTPGSLKWHISIMNELYRKYGRHKSLYGWYVSAEIHGALMPPHLIKKAKLSGKDAAELKLYRDNLIEFFKGLREESRKLSPTMPIMLASNSHYITKALDFYPKLMENLDIICPFGFHRMPPDDIDGEKAARLLQDICDEKNAHLWMDLEIFIFGKRGELLPRPVEGIIDDLKRFNNFEKILCYQFPGLMNAPWAEKKPGIEESVKLFKDYLSYVKSIWVGRSPS